MKFFDVKCTSTLMHAGNGDITKKLKCASGVLAIAGVAIAVSLIALMVVFIEVYPPYTSSYFAFTENGDVTISLGIVNMPWYSSVTIEQHEDHFHTTMLSHLQRSNNMSVLLTNRVHLGLLGQIQE